MPDSPAVHIITLGCPKNEVDSDRMLSALHGSAYRAVDTPEEADVVVVNTCAFIQEATEESIDTVLALATDWKASREGRHIVVAGCMPSRYGGDLESALTEADAFVPVAEEGTLLARIEELTGTPAQPRVTQGRTTPGPFAYVQVSDGCHRRCAYCTIPAIRGPYCSRPLDEIVAEATSLVSAGAKEIILIGQDISAYGRDFDRPGVWLPQVVSAVALSSGAERVRLMYVQPDGVTDELLDTMASHANVCRYLDIPLQHASESVLTRMHRSGGSDAFLRTLARVRRRLTGVSLRTTLIAGFPGETEEDVRITEEFLAAAAFDHVGVFTFSPEEGTEAALLDGQLPEDVRLARTQRLRDAADEAGFERAAARAGTVEKVIVDVPDEDGEPVGRTCGQAPDIDGVVLLDKALKPGTLVDVRIVDSIAYDLIGEVLS